MNGYNFYASTENPCSFFGQEENQQDNICPNQNRCLFKLNCQAQQSISITSKSTTKQSGNEQPQDNYQSQFYGSNCKEQTQNDYLSSDDNFNKCSEDLDQPEVQSIKDESNLLMDEEQEINENGHQQLFNNNNNNLNQNLHYPEDYNINHEENVNQNYPHQDSNVLYRQQSSNKTNSFENQQQQYIHDDESHDFISINKIEVVQQYQLDDSFNQCSLDLDLQDIQSSIHELSLLLTEEEQLNKNGLCQKPFDDNNNNQNLNLYHFEQNNINYQENANQNYSYQDQYILDCLQFSNKTNCENQQQQQIDDESHEFFSINKIEDDQQFQSDDNFNESNSDLDRPEVQSIKDESSLLLEQQQVINQNDLDQKLFRNNNIYQNQNLHYLEENNINHQENANQNHSNQDSNIQENQQFSNQSNMFENQQKKQIHHESHNLQFYPSSINKIAQDCYPSINQCNLNENNNQIDDLEEKLLNKKIKLSETKIRAIQKNKKAYSVQYTCNVCDNRTYADYSGLSNHVKQKHPGFKAYELSVQPNKTLGRPKIN
ncbi:hypothetical protein ABPG74_013631 [Tetrahymena malaccensis]